MKEFFRKKIVTLKRSPHLVALLLVLFCCVFYTCSLGGLADCVTLFSPKKVEPLGIDYPLYAQFPAMLLFVNTLLSILSFISYFSAHPRGKLNKFMASLTLLMMILMVVADLVFVLAQNYYISLGDVIITSEIAEQAVNSGKFLSIAHIVMVSVTFVVICVTPLFGKLLNKINTDVVDDYDTLMEQKSEEELMLELEDDK